MFNIWYLLLHSFNITIVALIILLMKRLFRDLLSARWQKGIWLVLFLRIIIPSSSHRSILVPTVGSYAEMLKFTVEEGLSSAYTPEFSLIRPHLTLPDSLVPVSITDYLYIAFFAGAAVFAAYYLISYIRLRLLIKNSPEVPDEVRREINLIAGKYNLYAPERIVTVKGLPSAFVCGFIKSVLVLPQEKETPEKIILHELLHLRHGDTFKSTIICILRCFNWFNPVMHYVFNVIGNDTEALCDLRTLEKLEGEERRDYGKLLLSMVNERYQTVPCTSSASNGGENIARRIDSIVKFKKYPKGMGVVSVCIVLFLIMPCLYGYGVELKNYNPASENEFNFAVASARSAKCTTMAGALDSFAKALSQKNGIMMILATHEDMHKEIITAMGNGADKELYYYETGKEFDSYSVTEGYKIYNLKKIDEKTYSAIIGFKFPETAEDMLCSLYNKKPDGYENYLFVPVIISYDNGWGVTESGERYTENEYDDGISQPNFGVYESKGNFGNFTLAYQNNFTVNNSHYADNASQMLGLSSYMYDPVPNADFETVWKLRSAVYTVYEDKKTDFYGKSMALQTRKFQTVEDYEKFMKAYEENEKKVKVFLAEYDFPPGSGGGSESWQGIDSTWKGSLSVNGGGGYSGSDIEREYKNWQPPAVEMAWVFCRNELIDEFTIFTQEEKQNDK